MRNLLALVFIIVMVVACSGCSQDGGDGNGGEVTTQLNRSTDSGGSDSSSQKSESEGETLFDSGSVTLDNGETYEWKSYRVSEDKIVIHSVYTMSNGTKLKQTNTLEKYPQSPDTLNMITVVPKMSGRSSWQHVTSNQGYTDLTEYYWKYFRDTFLMDGPIH